MPLLALRRFQSYISKKYFYTLGVKSVNKAAYTLAISLFLICFISYPVVRDYTYPHRQSTTDFIDGYAWQFSPHVYVTNTSSSPNYIIQQVHLTTKDQDTNIKDLLKSAFDIYTSLTQSKLTWNGETISLQNICATLPGHSTCVVHSPLAYWDNNWEYIERVTDYVESINRQINGIDSITQLSLHPYTLFGNVTFNKQGLFTSADSLIMTILLKSSALDRWNVLWQRTASKLNWHQLNIAPLLLQYKLKLLPTISSHTLLVVLCGMGILFYIRIHLSQTKLLKSRSGLGIAVLFLSVACYTTAMGLFRLFQVQVHVTPWFLQILVCTTSTLEHALLLTAAVVSREKEITVKERMGRGFQQVGVLMTSTLIGELIILFTGSAVNNVRMFCLFSSVALVLAYLFNLTLFTAILSIDIKRAELTDLGNEDNKKYLHHRSRHDRKFKTGRAVNALFLCFVLLYLITFGRTEDQPVVDSFKYEQLSYISNQFWHTLNPLYDNVSLEVRPPYVVFLNTEDERSVDNHINQLTSHYNEKLAILQNATTIADRRGFDIVDALRPFILFILGIDIPSILLIAMFIGILLWMIPYIREQILLPILRIIFVRVCTFILRIISKITPFKTDYWIRYNEEGMHIGAISMQSQFNKLQNQNHVRNVEIHTLAGKHIADISRLHASQTEKIVSIDQLGKIILWSKSEWMARLDRLGHFGDDVWIAEMNPRYYGKQLEFTDVRSLPRALSAQIDREGKRVIAGFDDGIIRVWNIETLQLLHELSIKHVVAEEDLRHQQKRSLVDAVRDRILKLAFLDEQSTTAIDMEPTDGIGSAHIILSVYKSGLLREWDIESGEMMQCINSGHVREITNICVLTNNQNSKQQFVFTSSKDGMIKCWKRCNKSLWQCLYTIHEHIEITSLAAQQLNNGMGVLVTGSIDNAVKVWNLNSGDALCTLSKHSLIEKKMPEAEVGGPLLQFSKVAESNTPSKIPKQNRVISDHSDSVCQVVVTRIGNPEFENDCCPDCHHVINSGFFVASCSLDNTVHTWRLDRISMGIGGCTRCFKDYHKRVWKDSTGLRRSKKLPLMQNNSGDDESDYCNPNDLSLSPLFLGKLDQTSSHDIVFCDNMVLAGVRRHQAQQWEVWFAALQYYEPPSLDTSLIPVITFDLEKDVDFLYAQKKEQSLRTWDQFLFYAFGVKKVRSSVNRPRKNTVNIHNEIAQSDDDDDEAYDILPFSAVRQVVATNGFGLCCDYGNFIKVVSFENPYSSAIKDDTVM